MLRSGFECGHQWADNHASIEELDRLAEIYERCHGELQHAVIPSCSLAESLAFILLGIEAADQQDEDAAADFWENAAGNNYVVKAKSVDFLTGFTQGAVSVYAGTD
jgi:hypothetical protein